MDYQKLGQKIHTERINMNLTQLKLSEQIGVSDTYLGAIERGEKKPSLDTLFKIANALGVTMDYLVNDVPETDDQQIIDMFRKIVAGQSHARKLMAISVTKTIFKQLNSEKEDL